MNAMVYTILAVSLLCARLPVAAQDSARAQIDVEAMALHMELAKPGPEHERLAELEGVWHQHVKAWMEPGAEPMEFSGVSTNRMILGGRFLQCESVSGEGPMRGESLNIFGFDRRSGHYTTSAFDSWGTYSVTAQGQYHEEGDMISMYGEDHDPAMGFTQQFDIILRFLDDDSFVWEIVFKDSVHTHGGDDFKMVEVTYTRADSGGSE